MNQVIFASAYKDDSALTTLNPFDVVFTPISDITNHVGDELTDKPNEDFIIEYKTPSKTIKTIEVNRETLNIQKIDELDGLNGFGEYKYNVSVLDIITEGNPCAIQIIRQDTVPHQRNSWYIELSGSDLAHSFWSQLAILAKSELLGITEVDEDNENITSKYPITFNPINVGFDVNSSSVIKNPYQYLQMLLTKHVQNFGYNHTDDNAELNSGLSDYKAWIAGTEGDSTVAVYRLRFATNRKASKTRDERVWQNVYICTKGENNTVAALLDAYIAILNGEETEGGE